jgi:hypothetical protein
LPNADSPQVRFDFIAGAKQAEGFLYFSLLATTTSSVFYFILEAKRFAS